MQTSVPRQAESFRDLWDLIGLLLLTAAAAGLILWLFILPLGAGWGRLSTRPDPNPIAKLDQTTFSAETGVRLVRVALTAGGGMLDLRYQTVDPDKAIVVHDDDNPPTLVDEATGQAVSIPWMDHSSAREMKAAITSSQLLMNPGGVLHRGSLITVIIGDSRLEHVVVQ